MSAVIWKVTDVKVTKLNIYPEQLIVIACGCVPSSGWSEPRLIPYLTLAGLNDDGLFDLVFLAEPPEKDSPDLSVLQSLVATYILTTIPEGLKGVRVDASENSKEGLLGDFNLPLIGCQ